MCIYLQPEEGAWHIEDLTAAVRLDMSGVTTETGLITEGCIVVVEGVFSDGIFKANVSILY